MSLTDKFRSLHDAFKRRSRTQQDFVAGEIAKTRLSVVDLIAGYAKNDEKISRSRLNSLLRDLDGVEKEIRTVTNTSVLAVMGESVNEAFTGSISAIKTVLGLPASFVTTGKVVASRVLSTLTGRKPTATNIAQYLAQRTGPDGLVLSDRVWVMAGDYRRSIGKVLQRGILRGDSIARMTRDITEVYEIEDWKARRLVITETNTAFRTAIGYEAERLDFVKGLRLNPGVHHSKACVALSQEDRHGLGAGVFLPSDTDIYNPHPNCTSYLTFILKDDEEVR